MRLPKIFLQFEIFHGRRNVESVHVEWFKGHYGLVAFAAKNANFSFFVLGYLLHLVLLLLSTIPINDGVTMMS